MLIYFDSNSFFRQLLIYIANCFYHLLVQCCLEIFMSLIRLIYIKEYFHHHVYLLTILLFFNYLQIRKLLFINFVIQYIFISLLNQMLIKFINMQQFRGIVYFFRIVTRLLKLSFIHSQQKHTKMQSPIPSSIYQNKKGIQLVLNAKPNSTSTMVQYIDNENIGFRIKAPAHDNEANKQLQRYLGELLAIKARQITIEQGSKCPSKIICIPSDKTTIRKVYQCLKANSLH